MISLSAWRCCSRRSGFIQTTRKRSRIFGSCGVCQGTNRQLNLRSPSNPSSCWIGFMPRGRTPRHHPQESAPRRRRGVVGPVLLALPLSVQSPDHGAARSPQKAEHQVENHVVFRRGTIPQMTTYRVGNRRVGWPLSSFRANSWHCFFPTHARTLLRSA